MTAMSRDLEGLSTTDKPAAAGQRLRQTTAAMYPNNTLGERLRLYVEENFYDA
jgi:hypothetical protein